MVFHFLSPGVGRNMQDRPARLPDTLQLPFRLQHTPDAAPAAVFSGRGIIITRISGQDATAAPCQGCRSYSSFFYYDSSFYLYKSTATCLPQTNISPRSSPLITCIGVPDVLYPYILIFSSGQTLKVAKTFVVKVRCLRITFIFIVNFFQSVVTDLPENTQKKNVFGQTGNSRFLFTLSFLYSVP